MQKSAFDTKYGVISKFIRVELKKETKNRKIQTHTQLAIRCINPDIPRGFTPQLLSGSCPAHQLTLMNSRNNYTRMTNNTIRRQIFRNTYISMSYIHSRVRHINKNLHQWHRQNYEIISKVSNVIFSIVTYWSVSSYFLCIICLGKTKWVRTLKSHTTLVTSNMNIMWEEQGIKSLDMDTVFECSQHHTY